MTTFNSQGEKDAAVAAAKSTLDAAVRIKSQLLMLFWTRLKQLTIRPLYRQLL